MCGIGMHRWQYSALSHILHDGGGFQRYGFASGIRTGYDKYAPFFLRQGDVQRYDLPVLLAQRQLEDRMASPVPFEFGAVAYGWKRRVYVDSIARLCRNEVELAEKAESGKHIVDMRAHVVGEGEGCV